MKVTNVGHNLIEAAGLVFRPRRTVDVKLTDAQVVAVKRNRRLRVDAPAKKAAPRAPETAPDA